MSNKHPSLDNLHAAVHHLQDLLQHHPHALPAAEGLLEGLVFMTGTLLGDPQLPEQLQSGYQGVLEMAHQLQDKLKSQNSK